mgnify:FL=1
MRIPNTRPIAEAGTHSFSREQAEPFAIRALRETFLSYPAAEQARIRAAVAQKLRDEAQRRQNQPSALARLARAVYDIRSEDL